MDFNWEKADLSSKQNIITCGVYECLLMAVSITSIHFALNELFIILFYNENPSLTYCHLCDNQIMRTIQIKIIKDTFCANSVYAHSHQLQ